MIFVEHVIKEGPVEISFDSLASLPQNDGALLIGFLVGLLWHSRLLSRVRTPSLGSSPSARHGPTVPHLGPPMRHGHFQLLLRDFPRLFRIPARLFTDLTSKKKSFNRKSNLYSHQQQLTTSAVFPATILAFFSPLPATLKRALPLLLSASVMANLRLSLT